MLPAEIAAMSSARHFRFGPESYDTAYEWGAGPLVILVHGWGGRAAQMAPLAVTLAAAGFRCAALDITGNGAPGRHFTRWSYFIRDIEAVTRTLQSEVFAYVGHSSGGTTMMAARARGLIRADRYVCVCSPSYPFLSVDAARNALDPSEKVMEHYKRHLADDFGIAWSELQAGGCYEGAGEDLLLVYAEKDRLVPHQEGDRIHVLCPGSTITKLKDYGHRSILTAPELARAANDFLTRGTR